jgi:hypothetical protein
LLVVPGGRPGKKMLPVDAVWKSRKKTITGASLFENIFTSAVVRPLPNIKGRSEL